MPKIIRQLISRLNGQFMSRLSAVRRDLHVPIIVTIKPERNTGSLLLKSEGLSIGGETKDLSESGVAFLVDSIRLREHYLVGENRVLNARLDLPNGTVRMQIIGQRYEQVDIHDSTAKYLIGASIHEMSDESREVYAEFLKHGNKLKAGKTQQLKQA